MIRTQTNALLIGHSDLLIDGYLHWVVDPHRNTASLLVKVHF
ncbi:hypothetical protein ACXR0M_25895 [Pseudomonas sp. Eth.TT006]